MRRSLVAIVCAACGKAAAPAPARCEPLPFASSIPIAEASGAAIIPEGMIVVADSGNHGAYVIVDPATGDVREQGALPLGEGSDDIEGIATPDGGKTIYGLVSDGTLYAWTRAGAGFQIASRGRIGDARDQNYEGLCLAPGTHGDGFAASKADGRLYRVHDLRVDPASSIEVARPEQLADCAFSPDGKTLLAGGNVFTADTVWTIDSATGAKQELGLLGPGNGEVVVVDDAGTVWRFSDLNTAPSLAAKYRCAALAR